MLVQTPMQLTSTAFRCWNQQCERRFIVVVCAVFWSSLAPMFFVHSMMEVFLFMLLRVRHFGTMKVSFPCCCALVDVNIIDRNGNTALHFVVGSGAYEDRQEESVRVLIKAGAKCDIANSRGETPLSRLLAKAAPTEVMIRLLLDAGAPVEAKSSQNGRTSCHIAAQFNNHQFVEMLISKHKADVNAIADCGETPLIVAVENRAHDVVSVLINAKALLDVARRDGATALHLAVKNGHRTIANALVAAGANVNVLDAGGWTPCHFAIALSDSDLVRRLIDASADVNGGPETSEPLLHVAAVMAKDDVIIRMLLAARANLNSTNKLGQTATRVAACNIVGLRALIDSGAAFDQPDVAGATPLSIAVKMGNMECASVLVAAGANATWADQYSNSLLHLYLSSNPMSNAAVVRRLVAWGVNVNALNAQKESACAMVAKCDKRECVLALFAIGAELSLPKTTSLSTAVFELLAAAAGDDHPCLAAARSQLVRVRGAEVCVGLQPLRLDALRMSEILRFACTGAGQHVPFHLLWNIAVKAKHFVKSNSG
jgi:ankyrin repeat protein